MFDLTNPEGVQEYLAHTPFAASSVVPLTGGYANFTYRITLREPQSPSGVNAPIKTLVMKHARPYVAAWKELPFAMERQGFECLALKVIPQLVAPSSIVNLPTLYYEDRGQGVILMADSGSESLTLKAILQRDQLSKDQARHIGGALGTFLGRLHAATHNPEPGTPAHATKTVFAKNHEARAIVDSFFFYGRILSTLTEEPSLLSPPLLLPSETLVKLDSFAQKAQVRVNASNDVLNMGDFRGENFLVVLEPAPRVMVVDWEIARPGFMGMDLGPFLAELHLLRIFHPTSRECVDIMVASFMMAYRAIILENGGNLDAEQRLEESAYDAAARIGTHLITVTPRIPWGSPEQTREIVQEGVEYVLRSMEGDEAWLRKSIVGGLWR